MDINILVIDDAPDLRVLEELQFEMDYAVNENSSIKHIINLNSENPLDYINFEKHANQDYNAFFSYLEEKYLTKKLDMLLCDFNLHADHKHIAFHIIDYIRSRNKCCTIILFSGSPLKELIRINNNDLALKISSHIKEENPDAMIELLEVKLEDFRKEESSAEELMEIAVKSGISAIVPRKQFDEKAIELIVQPSLLLRIENELLLNGNLTFNDGNERIDGIRLADLAKHVREQSEEGVYFIKEIVQLSLDNMLKLTNS